jgi:hypothetical protein
LEQKRYIILCVIAVVIGIILPITHYMAEGLRLYDFDTFYNATLVVQQGKSPWEIENILMGTEHRIQGGPYLYPPTSFLAIYWIGLLEKPVAQLLWQACNVLALMSGLFLLKRKTSVNWDTILLILALSYPVLRSLQAGQVNLIIFFLLVLVVCYKSGVALAFASAVKISPAFLMLPLLLQKQWRTVIIAALSGLLFVAMTIPLFSLGEQIHFVRHTLPELSTNFLDLNLPLFEMEHHSLTRLFITIWPNEDPCALSTTAAYAHKLLVGGIAFALGWIGYTQKRESSIYLLCAWVVLMVISPVFTWSAHHVFLLIPTLFLVSAIENRSLNAKWAFLIASSIVTLSLPQETIRLPGQYFPEIDWILRNLKLSASLLLGAACLEAHRLQPSGN